MKAKKLTDFVGKHINKIALALAVFAFCIIVLYHCTGCATAPAPETVRAPAEIHAEGLAYSLQTADLSTYPTFND